MFPLVDFRWEDVFRCARPGKCTLDFRACPKGVGSHRELAVPMAIPGGRGIVFEFIFTIQKLAWERFPGYGIFSLVFEKNGFSQRRHKPEAVDGRCEGELPGDGHSFIDFPEKERVECAGDSLWKLSLHLIGLLANRRLTSHARDGRAGFGGIRDADRGCI